jgi:hypothetical protein
MECLWNATPLAVVERGPGKAKSAGMRLLPLIVVSLMSCLASGFDFSSCPFDKAAVPTNLNQTIVNSGPLYKYGYQLLIDGHLIEPYDSNGTVSVMELDTGVDYEIRINVTQDRFRGALFRLAAPNGVDTNNALLPDGNNMTQTNSPCLDPVASLVTTDFDPKPGITGILRMNEAATITLDITIVKEFTDQIATYSYSQYKLQFVGAPSPTTVAGPSASAPSTAPQSSVHPPAGAPSQPTSNGFCSMQQVVQCQASSLSTSSRLTCQTCISDALLAVVSTCTDLQTNICNALQSCPCGGCASVIESYLDCAYQELVGCTISCSASTPIFSLLQAVSTVVDEFAFTT